MDEAELIALLEQLASALITKFAKKYSAGRLEQITSHIATLKMLVGHIHDEAVREEEPTRKDGVARQLVLAGMGPNEAQAAVERGER